MKYDEYLKILSERLKTGSDFYLSLLKNIIDNPYRYSGLFWYSNSVTKMMQNITQSIEIKFGDFLEDIVREYFSRMGYENLNNKLMIKDNKDKLLIDQFFKSNDTLFVIEMKIRDDHDSTKKRSVTKFYFKS
ncbi:hypothetical protein CJJ23_03040 [Mycoplasmopsis agassizii]|uniref:Uncharacterized protein n=1 Tax=Mycoplasmopsis agassizii TaxID=33922 RepID=A0A269TJM1_9BACT|nr:type II restriction endonuclease [Mycoplasmopsis agassizii]PAK21226.1 hypothetical protein CJJ23_03040 [Mycoplasmopsis agassizii]